MTMQGFSHRCGGTLRWMAPVVAMALGAAVGIAFAAVVLSQGGSTVAVKDQARMEQQP